MAKASVDIFIGKFVAILESEAASIAGVHDQVDEIKQELVFMKSFLADADEGNKVDTQVEEAWIGSIRDLANDVENIIDEFMYHIYVQHRGRRFARWLRKTIHFPKNLWYKRQIANKLQKIAVRIRAIHERNQRYGGRAAVEGKNQAESSLYQKEDELVGIEGDKNMLMGWLMNKEEHQIVVSVVGMGGSGKTTLVARTFTNHVVKSHFELAYKIDDRIPQSKEGRVPTNMNSMSRHELLEILVNYLEIKRYLVVLDDVWDIHLWEKIRFSFPDTQLGSRIMITTRREDIASSSFRVESHVHKIRPLERSDAWVLFSKKAFSRSETMEETGALRLSIQTTNGEIGYSCTGLSRLRSFSCVCNWRILVLFLKTLLFDLTLLRVLDLEDVPIDNLPDEVTYLFNLKYLNLRGTPIKELPESIGQLRNLQTLNIMDTNIEALPRGFPSC
ncbi:NB-ARC domain-containing disease resistance protein [Prunus dulcis]|uniref:NB-ARC domain-containing disease resistance protein n=1 Tax=Prunus dulcis TaxID=3755 RepID=A0A4Y1RN77_PRUDU|nr:NB-ARC domain-containing disease resistance protein [Prunus dulcis]